LLFYSAGGGGKSESRKTKLKEKNEKLAAERERIAKEQKKQKPKDGPKQNNDSNSIPQQNSNDEFAGIHPSRRAWMG
jgi:nucleolar protein 6